MGTAADTSQNGSAADLVVVGAGPGGYPAAFHAADLGMRVILIDTEPTPGGVCLYRGCIPSKALLHAAGTVREAREAEVYGIRYGKPEIDIATLRNWKQSVVDKLTGGLGMLCKQRKVEYVCGHACLTGNHSLEVIDAGGGRREIRFDQAILAPGSIPARIPIAPDSPLIMDSTDALALDDIPASLLLVGGGYIGLELGQVYAALGATVSVVEMMPGLLPGADPDLVAVLAKALARQFDTVMLNTRVSAMETSGEGVRVTLTHEDGSTEAKQYGKALIAVGRKPNTRELGLDTTRVTVGKDGFIETDAQRRTAETSLFAIGDAAGQPMLAHKATYEGKVAAEAAAGRKTAFEATAIPAVVFTDPEIAWCGLTADDARAQGIKARTLTFPWAASGRALTLGHPDGLTKLLIEEDTERVLGVAMVGHGAGELIAEGVLAVEMGAVAADLALSIHPHPTLSETIMEAAEAAEGQSTHVYNRARSR